MIVGEQPGYRAVYQVLVVLCATTLDTATCQQCTCQYGQPQPIRLPSPPRQCHYEQVKRSIPVGQPAAPRPQVHVNAAATSNKLVELNSSHYASMFQVVNWTIHLLQDTPAKDVSVNDLQDGLYAIKELATQPCKPHATASSSEGSEEEGRCRRWAENVERMVQNFQRLQQRPHPTIWANLSQALMLRSKVLATDLNQQEEYEAKRLAEEEACTDCLFVFGGVCGFCGQPYTGLLMELILTLGWVIAGVFRWKLDNKRRIYRITSTTSLTIDTSRSFQAC